MKIFHNQSISIRLALCFTLLILITSILGVSSIINTNKIKHFTEQVYTTAIVPALDNDSCIVTLYKIKDNLNTLLISNTPEKATEYKNIIVKNQKVIQDSLDAFTHNNTLTSNQNLLTEIASSVDILNQQIDLFINLLDQNNQVEATSLLNNTISPLIETLQSHYQLLNEEHNTSISKLITTDVNLSHQAILLTIVILVSAILISLFLILLINKTMTIPLKKLILVARQISVGDLTNTYTIDGRDEIALLSTSLTDVSIHIKSLVTDADMLTKAAIEGRLDTRADASKHNGDFAKIVEGVNQTLDAVIGPLNVAAEYVDRISKGDIPPKITDHYNGDFNEIKNNLNLCIDTIKSLVADADMLSKAAIEGRLDTRADASKHSGDFAKIVEGVNQTLDAVIGPLNVAAEYVDRISKGDIPPKITDHYNGDFNEIKNNLNLCIDTVKSLVADTNILIKAAIEGRLDTRADASKHSGDFAKIIEGVNKTLDAVIKPLKEYTNVLNEMSTGNLQIRVVGNYNGDLAEVKYALNSTLDFLSGYVQEISDVLMEMAHSNMVITITKEYKGDFLKIKDALSLIIASLNQVLGEVNTTADEVAFSARQVSNSSTSLAEGSTKEATSIDSLTSSITQIATQTKQNATASNDVKDISLTTRSNALKGNKEMDKMLTAMVDINETCNNIFKIIKVIDDIAFQTNILALNASVEAARAGQQGKGFAVVAEEVRNLASKAASAAKETALLIEKCMDSVKVGTNIANTTAESLNHIVEGIEKVTHLVSHIATASSEQQLAVEQVNQNIYTISSVVQTTSATAEETAAASEQLSNQAELLKQQILKFKLKS